MPISFSCPCCRAHLKVRDESAVGQTLECPECRAPLLVAISASGEILGQLIAEQSSDPRGVEKPSASNRLKSTKTSSAKSDSVPQIPTFQPRSKSGWGWQNPQVVAWSVAGVFLLGFISILIFSDRRGSGVSDPSKELPTAVSSVDPVEPLKAEQQIAANLAPPPAAPLPDSPDGRLQALGKVIRTQASKVGHFPSGTVSSELPVAHRWSWLAQIAAEQDNPTGTRIDWNQRWSDPVTDRFVRRPIPRFQNSQVEVQTSEDKYPASHFVGVAGVGSDAPTLPTDHPRAGIFGQDRKTTMADIRDGLSNTMMIAGVEQHPGSWAEGATSYRAFTREPYLHGPDGFGTGQPKSMFVLMADGSVKEISSDADPRIVRRMAAMNDGLPLDSKVPGEPGDTTPATPNSVAIKPSVPTAKPKPDDTSKVAQAPAKPPRPEDQSTKPQTPVPPEVVVDIPAALSRKILSFDQVKPAAAYQLLLQIEELSGVRIDYDRQKLGAAAERLDKPISLRMKNASLEELLSDILRQIELQRKDEKSRITIVTPSRN